MQFDAPIVIDNGTNAIKAGLSGKSEPTVLFSSVNGTALPITRGRVTDWDQMETVWRHAIEDRLHVTTANRRVLLTEQPLTAKQDREKAAQIMFESFNAPAMYLAIQPVLSLYASGRTTGVVVEIGHGVSHVVPANEGYAVTHAMQRADVAGLDLTNYLAALLSPQGTIAFDTAQAIKERFCAVAGDTASANNPTPATPENFQLPDGNTISIGNERFRCCEGLFDPSTFLNQPSTPSIPKLILQGIQATTPDIHPAKMYENIVLAGGTTLLPGLDGRINKELSAIAPTGTAITITAPSCRKTCAWTGGSILAALSTFDSLWVTRAEYDEHGAAIVHKKCA